MAADGIKQKIAALLRLTTAAGCTEAEALAAAEKAAALMREHGLSEADITVGQASVGVATKGRGARDQLWRTVAYCTNTAQVYVTDRGERRADLVFVGRDPGPDIAAYLVAVLNRAVDTGIAEFKAGTFYRRRRSDTNRRACVRDFTLGMVHRLSRRLIEIFGPSIDKAASSVAVAARDARFVGLVEVTAPVQRDPRYRDAVSAGWNAGGAVNLAHGVHATEGERRQIGGAT